MFLKTVTALFICFSFFQSHAQTFQTILRKSDKSSQYMRKLVAMNDAEIACLTHSEFYRIGKQGNILFHKTIGAAEDDLQDLVSLANGQFLLATSVYRSGSVPEIKICKMDGNGTFLLRKEFPVQESFDQLKIILSGDNHFFLVYVHAQKDGRHVDVRYMDYAFNEIWHQHTNFKVYHTIHAISGDNDGLEFILNDDEKMELQHFIVDIHGNLDVHQIQYKGPQDSFTLIRKLVKTPDGGYLYSGVEFIGFRNEDILMVKTDQQGNTEWVKRYNFFLGDMDDNIEVVPDGYIMLARTGYNPYDLNANELDISMIKFTTTGEITWIRSYGTAMMDYPKSLLVNADGSFTIGGQSTTYYMTLSEPVVFKTNPDGYFPEIDYPYQLVSPAPMKQYHVDPESPIQRMTGGALLPDGGMVMSTSIIDTTVDWLYPFITRTDVNGAIIWHRPAPQGYKSELLKPMPDGKFIAVASWQDDFYITKLNDAGHEEWTTHVEASYLKDVIMAPDGGYLLCGMQYEGSGAQTRNLLVIKLSQTGQEIWRYRHSINRKWIYGRSIKLTPENDILVAGFIQEMQNPVSATYLAKISAQGTLKWYKSYPRGNNIAVGNKLIITSEQDYLITGYVRYPGDLNKQDILLLKTDQQGNLRWEKEYNIDKLDAGISVIEYGGQYYIAGTTGQPEFGARESFGVLLRTDGNGVMKGFTSFGNRGSLLSCADLAIDEQNKIHFMGTTQYHFALERPFKAILFPENVTGISDPVADKNVMIYPVPASGSAFLKINDNYTGDIRITVSSVSGRRLHTFTTLKTQFSQRIPLPVSILSTGTYFVEIQLGAAKYIRKLLIQK